jgi:hypothetical protein
LFRDDINKRLHLSAEEMQMAACISGQDHVAEVSNFAVSKAVDLIRNLPSD